MNDNILIYMTSIGSILSVFGVFAIFTTAVLFKSWRKAIGTKIVLNISFCILLQSILLYTNLKINDITCIISGTLLHYIVLCGFMWSLIMAYLHYKRFIKILGNTTSHLLLKTLFFGWILPLIPIGIVHSINSKTYLPSGPTDNFICYPSGIFLYTTVHLPIGIIIFINFMIFSFIIYKVHTDTKRMTNFRNNCNEREMIITEIKLAVLLFFSLSLTWIFGLLASTQYCDFCFYLFAATASSQGFVLFIYYILFNKEVRVSWVELVRPNKKKVTSSAVSTATKSNVTNEENELNNTDKNNLNSTKDNEKTMKNMNTHNDKELRKRLKIQEDNSGQTPKRDITIGKKATSDSKYNIPKICNSQEDLVMQELKEQQMKRNSPFRK